MDGLQTLQYDVSDRICRITLNRPGRGTGLSAGMIADGEGPHATQVLGTVFDGIARHTAEGYAFQQRAADVGFKQAVAERDDPFGDASPSTFKG